MKNTFNPHSHRRYNKFHFNFKSHIRHGWQSCKWLILLTSIFILAGIILAVVVISDAMLDHFRITRDFLDGNIINVASPNRTIFSFLLVRIADIGFALLLVFLFNLSKWTMWITFPYVGFRVFWHIINLFWILDRYGFLHGATFFFFYLIVFVFILVLFAIATVYLIKKCAQIRKFGFRTFFRWAELKRPLLWITTSVLIIGFIEWLLYFLVLGRMIYMI